jgi:hypothetical protein
MIAEGQYPTFPLLGNRNGEFLRMRSTIPGSEDLQDAAIDFHYLLNRGYPRKTCLELIGNRYTLSFDQRHILHRGIFSDPDAKARKGKRVSFQSLRNRKVAIDGHNVLITVEAALAGRPLVSSNDGFVRDISGLSGNFRKTRLTDEAISLLLEVLKRARPLYSFFLFDAPISKSGLLAFEVRKRLKKKGLQGEALAIHVPEKVLFEFSGIVATSDTVIIDRSEAVFDLAGFIIKNRIRAGSLVTLKVS